MVVLQFRATIEILGWMRRILQNRSAVQPLHLLDVPEEICIALLHAHNGAADHPFAATEEQFHRIYSHVLATDIAEGFKIVRRSASDTGGPEQQ